MINFSLKFLTECIECISKVLHWGMTHLHLGPTLCVKAVWGITLICLASFMDRIASKCLCVTLEGSGRDMSKTPIA